MPLPNDSYSASRAACQPIPHHEVNLGLLKKALRFLGISRVRVLYQVEPQLPAKSHAATTKVKNLSDRIIQVVVPSRSIKSGGRESRLEFHETDPQQIWTNIAQRYLGFRANGQNLGRLYNDVLQSQVALNPGETKKHYRSRVALAFVASGLGDMQDDSPQGLHGLNRPVSREQLSLLEDNLSRPLHEVMRDVNSRNSQASLRLDREIDRHPRLLMEVCARMPIETKQDVLFVDRHCRHYMTSGEGEKVLEKHAFPALVGKRMEKILPRLPSDGVDDQVIHQARQFQKTCGQTDSTENTGKTINDIYYAPEKSEQHFNPDSPEHRCLVMIQSMAMGWQSYCDGRSQAAFNSNNDEDEDMATRLLEAKRTLNNLWLAMSHNIMLGTKDFSTNFDRKNYQQVVLISDDDKTVYWNSDNVQPRGGWFDSRRFEPVTLPK